MKRPSDGTAIGFASALGVAATVAVALAGIELANPHGDIWANSWTYVAISLAGIGLIIASAAWLLSLPDRQGGNPGLHYGKSTWIRGHARPDSEAGPRPEDEETGLVHRDSHAKSQASAHMSAAASARLAGEAAAPADDNAPPRRPGGSALGRAELAADLETLAERLRTTSRRLKRAKPYPGQDVTSFWRMGLEEAGQGIDEADRLQVGCQSAINEEPEDYDGDYTAQVLRNLERAVTDAFGAQLAALDSLEHPDQPFTPGSRSEYYLKAVDQLTELASHCRGLAVLLRGPQAL